MKTKCVAWVILGVALIFPGMVLAGFDPTVGGRTNLPDASITSIASGIVRWIFAVVGLVGAGFLAKRRFF